MVLLLFAVVGGAFLGAGSWPGIGTLTLLLITGGLAAAGASALNHYLEQDSDALMTRTRQRPLVTKSIARSGAKPARLLFKASNLYLTLVLFTACIDILI